VTLPKGAELEARIAGGVHLWDVSHLLPRAKRTKRDEGGIDRLFVHHSGALGRAGFDGALASARYVVSKRGFPGPAYAYWVPAEDYRDDEGALVVLRLNADSERSWHTGGKANDRGVAVALQGSTTARPMTHSHEECLEALIPWCAARYSLPMPKGLSWHSRAKADGGRSKATCPGKGAEAWLRGYLRGYRTEAA
jgi:hypothetical protein